ncbi:MAG: pyruvate, phosphate dikinase [Thermaerobacter sp.]
MATTDGAGGAGGRAGAPAGAGAGGAAARFVYDFDQGDGGMRDLLGGKGANLAEMTRAGLPVPPGFTVTTEACRQALAQGGRFPEGLEDQVFAAMARLEARTGKGFGNPENPLLVSVRSGAAVSMPGMMDTILNLGLNDRTVQGLARQTGDPRFAWDCYRRFVQMFADVVLGVPLARFEERLEARKRARGAAADTDLDAADLEALTAEYLDLAAREAGRPFPLDPREQLLLAVGAVFRSWLNERAVVYRRAHRIPDDLGTAVNVQAMVFGNMGPDSGTGVLFTRDPNTGEKVLYGEYLPNAQGEDVVAGIRTPLPISRLAQEHPDLYAQLSEAAARLERHYRDMQDIEFTVERGRLYLLQTRAGKRTAAAAVRIACDLVQEGLIDQREAVRRVEPQQIQRLLHKTVAPEAAGQAVAQGLPASPGAAGGAIVFDPDEAQRLAAAGTAVILVRPETTPDDIHGMIAAQGILTSRGGMTCHAAIVARGMGKPCVVGCDAVQIDLERGVARIGDVELPAGARIAIDGSTGRVFAQEVPLVDPETRPEFETLLGWADQIRRLGVRANADTPEDAARARAFGAEGIGLCRTEHMFMGADRLPLVQRMILAETEEERREALEQLLPVQRGDFYGILKAMAGLPVTVRLLDPPLHEFLPDEGHLAAEAQRLRQEGGDPAELARVERMLARVRALAEANPMLGHRGCRLAITFPEIYAMQARALFEAAAQLRREGVDARPEVMIPLVAEARELERLRRLVEETAARVSRETGVPLDCPVGTMIEVPRACVTAGQVARFADFFSFGTNDLTQTTFGFSRDDAEAKFLHRYLEEGILEANPFITLDVEGVGSLIRMAVSAGRAARPGLKVGICGEHGGDPDSIAFCHRAGLDYVSCSPFRVAVARLAAAHAALADPGTPAGLESS